MVYPRRSLTSVAVLGAVLLAGCAADSDEEAEPEAGAVESESEPEQPEEEEAPEAADLDAEAVLLALDDMPTGWTQQREESDAEVDDASEANLCDAESISEDASVIDDASRQFTAGDLGPILDHAVATFEDGQAEQVFDDFRRAFDGCTEWTGDTGEGPMTFRPSPLSFPSFGDETVAMRIAAENDMVDVTLDMVGWRRGDVISLIAVLEVFGSPDAEQTEAFVTVADQRLTNPGEADEASAAATETEPVEKSGQEAEEAQPEPGSEANPLAIGESAEVGDWTVTVINVDSDAEDEILEANSLNAPSPEGSRYVLIEIETTYNGDEPANASTSLRARVLGSDARTYGINDGENFVTAPDSLSSQPEVRTGGTVEGGTVIEMPTDALDDPLIAIDEMMSFSDDSARYWATD
jgi:hypothetical protein